MAIDEDIIKVDKDELSHVRPQHLMHEPHERVGCIRQCKGHDHQLVQPKLCLECGFPPGDTHS
jgi:NAD-dependent dihydropyrimidine dehydrogenase PreA subunit